MGLTLQTLFDQVRLDVEDSLLPSEADRERYRGRDEWWDDRLDDAYELHPTEAPGAYSVMERVRQTLGVPERVTLFQVPTSDRDDQYNACVGPRRADPLSVMVMGRMLDVFGESELAYVFGHELGHYYETSIGPDPRYRYSLSLYQQRVQSALRMGREMSCDRVGLLASQSRPAAMIVEAYAAAGLGNSGLKINPKRYLERARAWVANRKKDHTLQYRTHPPQLLRVYAVHEFGSTKEYRELTGKGPGSRTLRSLDRELRELLLPPAIDRTQRKAIDRPTEVPPERAKVVEPVKPKVKEKRWPTFEERVAMTAESVGKALEGAVTRGARWILDDDVDPRSTRKPAEDFLDPLADDEKRLLERFEALEKKLERD